MRIFDWDARRDRFVPGSEDEVIERSYRLKELRRLTGWNEDELADELRRRTEFLANLWRKIISYTEVSEALISYYRRESSWFEV